VKILGAIYAKGIKLKFSRTTLYLSCVLLSACGTSPISPSDKHITQPDLTPIPGAVDIPQPNTRTIPLPLPKPAAKIETYSVVVSNVPAQEILFALARDAKINLDISSGIQGNVSINAINQTLPQILERISKQVEMRYELDNGTLSVMPDKPFLKTYKIDFINMNRSTKSSNSTSGQINNGGPGSLGGSNAASTITTSETKNDLMESLVKNVTDIILEEDRLRYKAQTDIQGKQQASTRGDGFTNSSIADGSASPKKNNSNPNSSDTANRTSSSTGGSGNQDTQGTNDLSRKSGEFEKSVNVFANKETGVLIVRATSKQHEKIQEFIDKVMTTAKRQVLIEATIVEVKLNDQYQQGINWSRALLGAQGFALSQASSAGIANTAGALTISYLDPTSNYGNLLASVSLLEKFGNVKVLSSPKLSVMNNQTASLKVAESKVYFGITSTPSTTNGTIVIPASYSSIASTVSVGFVMSVTPQISDNNMVTINVRPTITRIIGYVNDPNPALGLIPNRIPEIQTREMESIIKVESGQTAIMGGLIQESIDKNSSEVPFLARIPLLGQLFQNRDDTTTKTELVIFIRPLVVKDASLNGDFKEFSKNLPNADFFHEDARGKHTAP
jgi:MSHA biogenesis protein MshL